MPGVEPIFTRPRLRFARASTLVTVTLLLACSPATVGSGDAGVSADQACTDSAYAKCSRYQACSPIVIQLRYGDESTCEAAIKQNCVNAIAAPSSGSTPQNVEACAQAVPSWDCPDYLYTQNPPPACVQVTGSIPDGGGCSHPSQCQSGFCAIVPGDACGSCAPPPQPGDSCAQLTTCGQQLSCQTSTLTCAVFAGEGAACGSSQPCAAGLNCIGSTSTTPGSCQVSATVPNAPCPTGSAGCELFAGLVCNSSSMTCQSAQLVAPGQPCGDINHQTVSCQDDVKCLGESGSTPGTCEQLAAVGGTCDLVNGPACPTQTRCVLSGDAGASDGGTSGTCQYAGTSACP
jgi:hypothetical protein